MMLSGINQNNNVFYISSSSAKLMNMGSIGYIISDKKISAKSLKKVYTTRKAPKGMLPYMIYKNTGIIPRARFVSEYKKAETPDSKEPFRWWNIAVIIAAILAYALALETLGFFICTFIFVGLLLKVVEPQPWKVAIVGGLIAAVSSVIVFNVLLQSRIPSGIFGY